MAREQLDRVPCSLLGVIVARRKAGSSYYAPRYYYRERDKTGASAPAAREEHRVRRD